MTRFSLPPSILRLHAIRAVVLWALLCAMVGAASILAGTSLHNPVWMVIVCPLLGVADRHRRAEVAFWSNLGVSSTQMLLLYLLVATLGELLISGLV